MKNTKQKRKSSKTVLPERFEQQMRDLVNHNLDGILVIGLDGIALFANPAACTLLNRPLATLLDVEIGLPLSGVDFTEIEIHHSDGSFATAEMRVHRIEWDGQPAWLADLRDITYRKKAEEALRKSEELYRSIYERLPVGYQSLDAEGRLVNVNRAWLDLMGYERPEVIGRRFEDFLNPEDIPTFRQRFVNLIHEGVETHRAEFKLRRKDGSLRIVDFSGCVSLDVSLLFKQTHCTLTDITKRKLAEDALQKSEERHRQISTLMSDYVYHGTVSANGSIETQWVSGAFERITGYTNEEVNQLPGGFSALVVPEDLKEVVCRQPDLIKNGTLSVEYRLRCKDGEIRWMRDYMQYLVGDESGNTTSILGAVQDITKRKHAELALMANEAMLKDAEQNAQLGYYNIEIDTGKAIWSDETYRIFGLERDSYNPDLSNYETHLHPEDRMKVYQLYEECAREQKPFDLTYRIIRPDGETRHVHSISSIKKKPDDTRHLFGTIQDVTERVQAEQELRVALVKFKTLFESFPLGISISDKTGKVLESNRMSEHLLGISREEHRQHILGGSTWKIVRSDGTPMPPEEFASVRALLEDRTVENVEMGIIQKDDSITWLSVTAAPLPLEGYGVVVTYSDISERKRAEIALRESEEKMRGIFRVAPTGIGMVKDRVVFNVNPRVCEMTGYTSEELIGQNSRMLYPSQADFDFVGVEKYRQIVEKGTGQVETRWRKKDGTVIDILLASTPIDLSDYSKGVIFTALDITERKRIERLSQAQLKRLQSLNDIDHAISSSLDMRLSLNVLLNETLSQLGVDAASVMLLNPVEQSLEFVAGHGFRTPEFRKIRDSISRRLSDQVVIKRKIIHIPSLSNETDAPRQAENLLNEGFVEYFGVPLIAKGEVKGVLEIFNRTPLTPDPDWLNYLETLGGQAAIAIDNAQLFERLQRSNQEMIIAYNATIAGWSRAMDLRDKETEGHTQRVSETTLRLANRMGISSEEQVHMRRGALLHDIGKLGVPDQILHKAGKLTDEEWQVMRQHPTYAYEMLASINYLHPALDIPYCHHEKWDGTGYPRGLKGGQIPLAARIFAIVDVWDALRSDRPYRAGWSVEKIREYILEQSGKHFDPQVVQAFMQMLDESPDLQ